MTNARNIRAGGAYVEITAKTDKLRKQQKEIELSFSKMGNNIAQQIFSIGDFADSVGMVYNAALKNVVEFDTQMRMLQATIRADNDEMVKLTKTAKELSGWFSAKEVGGMMTILGRAGFDAKTLPHVTGPVTQMAAVGQVAPELASEMASNVLRQFELPTKSFKDVADKLTYAANASNMSLQDLAYALSYVGTVAHQSGQGLDETLGQLMTLANVGIKGSMAGTSLANMFKRSAAPTTLNSLMPNAESSDYIKAQQENLAILKKAGIQITDSENNFRPLMDILHDINTAFKDNAAGNAEVLSTITKLYQSRGAMGAMALITNTKQTYANIDSLKNSPGYLAEAQARLNQGPEGRMRTARNNFFASWQEQVTGKDGNLKPLFEGMITVIEDLSNHAGTIANLLATIIKYLPLYLAYKGKEFITANKGKIAEKAGKTFAPVTSMFAYSMYNLDKKNIDKQYKEYNEAVARRNKVIANQSRLRDENETNMADLSKRIETLDKSVEQQAYNLDNAKVKMGDLTNQMFELEKAIANPQLTEKETKELNRQLQAVNKKIEQYEKSFGKLTDANERKAKATSRKEEIKTQIPELKEQRKAVNAESKTEIDTINRQIAEAQKELKKESEALAKSKKSIRSLTRKTENKSPEQFIEKQQEIQRQLENPQHSDSRRKTLEKQIERQQKLLESYAATGPFQNPDFDHEKYKEEITAKRKELNEIPKDDNAKFIREQRKYYDDIISEYNRNIANAKKRSKAEEKITALTQELDNPQYTAQQQKNLEGSLKKATGNLDSYNGTIEKLNIETQKATEHQKKVNAINEKIASLTNQRKEMQTKANRSLTEIDSQINNLNKELKTANRTISSAKKQTSKVDSGIKDVDIEQLRQERTTLQSQLINPKLSAEKAKELQNKLTENKAKQEEIVTQRKALRLAKNELKTAQSELKTKEELNKVYKERIETEKNEIAKLKKPTGKMSYRNRKNLLNARDNAISAATGVGAYAVGTYGTSLFTKNQVIIEAMGVAAAASAEDFGKFLIKEFSHRKFAVTAAAGLASFGKYVISGLGAILTAPATVTAMAAALTAAVASLGFLGGKKAMENFYGDTSERKRKREERTEAANQRRVERNYNERAKKEYKKLFDYMDFDKDMKEMSGLIKEIQFVKGKEKRKKLLESLEKKLKSFNRKYDNLLEEEFIKDPQKLIERLNHLGELQDGKMSDEQAEEIIKNLKSQQQKLQDMIAQASRVVEDVRTEEAEEINKTIAELEAMYNEMKFDFDTRGINSDILEVIELRKKIQARIESGGFDLKDQFNSKLPYTEHQDYIKAQKLVAQKLKEGTKQYSEFIAEIEEIKPGKIDIKKLPNAIEHLINEYTHGIEEYKQMQMNEIGYLNSGGSDFDTLRKFAEDRKNQEEFLTETKEELMKIIQGINVEDTYESFGSFHAREMQNKLMSFTNQNSEDEKINLLRSLRDLVKKLPPEIGQYFDSNFNWI